MTERISRIPATYTLVKRDEKIGYFSEIDGKWLFVFGAEKAKADTQALFDLIDKTFDESIINAVITSIFVFVDEDTDISQML